MGSLATMLSRGVDLPVLDRTGLSGDFALELQWTPDQAAAPSNDLPSVFTAVQEQLGLRLERTTGPVDVIVIDRALPPTAN